MLGTLNVICSCSSCLGKILRRVQVDQRLSTDRAFFRLSARSTGANMGVEVGATGMQAAEAAGRHMYTLKPRAGDGRQPQLGGQLDVRQVRPVGQPDTRGRADSSKSPCNGKIEVPQRV